MTLRSPLRFGLLFLLLGACKDGPPPAPTGGTDTSTTAANAPTPTPAAPSTALTVDDSGKSLTLSAGAPLTVKLPSTAGTGFRWDVTQGDANILAPQGGPTTEQADPGRPGSPTLQVFSFVAKAAGTTHLEISFHRPWEQTAAAKKFSADITVR